MQKSTRESGVEEEEEVSEEVEADADASRTPLSEFRTFLPLFFRLPIFMCDECKRSNAPITEHKISGLPKRVDISEQSVSKL